MTSRFLLACLFLALAVGSGGCSLFRRGAKTPKTVDPLASGTPVADLESSFKERWISRRAAELTATGVDTSTAQNRATQEYAEAYRYTKR